MIQFEVVEENGQKFAKVPLDHLEALEALEDILDINSADAAMRIGGEPWPSELVNALAEGGNPVKLIREWRGVTQRELAVSAGVTQGYVSSLEKGVREPSMKILAALCHALKVDADDLLPWP